MSREPGSGWIDVTRPLHPDMDLYPGDPPVRFHPHARLEGEGYVVSRLELGSHSGTHVDAPSHLLPGAATVDELSPEALCGAARLVVPGPGSASPGSLARACPPGVERLLFRTRPGGPPWIDGETARRLAGGGLRLLGWDRLSIDRSDAADLPAHRALLSRGVVVLEGLDLADLPPGEYEMVALPLRLRGLDGSPARVLLRPR